MTSQINPKAVQVISKPKGKHTFVLNEDALSKLLMQDKIKDRFVCVVSVAGALRQGKSFLLNFFLRYLYSKYVRHDVTDWLDDKNEPLLGFSWRSGTKGDTTGILMWPDIFVHDYPNGDKVAIILIDTQGFFDSQSTTRDCATVFALSCLLSSVQIYNLLKNIQEDYLQHLELFTRYGQLVLNDSRSAPFQRLQFVVRDWNVPSDYKYGAEGGDKFLKHRLDINDKQQQELQTLRLNISSCFEKISCFLMPYPGEKVDTEQNCLGCLKDINKNFTDQLSSLVPMLLAPENLVCKRIFGQRILASDLVRYFKLYVSIFQGDKLPDPHKIYDQMAELTHLRALDEAKKTYITSMDNGCLSVLPSSKNAFDAVHRIAKELAIDEFNSARKHGSQAITDKYLAELHIYILKNLTIYKSQNDAKFNKLVITSGVMLLGLLKFIPL